MSRAGRAACAGRLVEPRKGAVNGRRGGNKTGTNRRLAKRLRFFGKKRVESYAGARQFRRPSLVTDLRRPDAAARVEMARAGRNAGQSAHESRAPRFAREKRAPASPYERSSGPFGVYGFPIVNVGPRRRSRRGTAGSKRGQKRRESATARFAGARAPVERGGPNGGRRGGSPRRRSSAPTDHSRLEPAGKERRRRSRRRSNPLAWASKPLRRPCSHRRTDKRRSASSPARDGRSSDT